MIIDKIERMKDLGVFREFTWPQGLQGFARYNLIYGWNGTGKTTISRLFANLAARETPPEGDVALRVRDTLIRGSEFGNADVDALVFNRDFVDNNVFQSRQSGMPPIVVIGQEDAEKQRRLDVLLERLPGMKENERTAATAVQRAQKSLTVFRTDQARRIRRDLLAPDADFYSKYESPQYQGRVAELRDADRTQFVLGSVEFDTARALRDATPMPAVAELTFSPPDVGTRTTEVSALAAQTVTSRALRTLTEDAALQEWVGQGYELHDRRSSGKCLFCEATIDKARWEALGGHFDQSYRSLQAALDSQITALEGDGERLRQQALPMQVEFHADLADEWKAANVAFENSRAAADRALSALVSGLREKKRYSSRTDQPSATINAPDWTGLVQLNALIRRNNEQSTNVAHTRQQAREALELHYIAETWGELEAHEAQVRGAQDARRKAADERAKLESLIAQLQAQLAEPERAAIDLTDELHAYLGHTDLRFEVDGTGYAVMRGEERAIGLSEGERTAIAVLYFLKRLDHKDFDLTQSVVVLDDPVSSLDAQALYLAFGYINRRTKRAAQLFVLTHNWQFFNLVKGWFGSINGDLTADDHAARAHFYMLDCEHVGANRSAHLKRLDPLLERYASEYHYWFSLVLDVAEEKQARGLEAYYVIPNVARRLVETFLAFQFPGTGVEFSSTLGNLSKDGPMITRIQRFLNIESHGEAIGHSQNDPSLLAETPEIMRDVLGLIEQENPKHYKRMDRAVRSSRGS